MKAKLKKNILFLISTFALLFASCTDFNAGGDDSEKVDFGSGYGSIRISLDDNARTAYPLINDYDEWTWTLKGTTDSPSATDANWVTIKTWEAGTGAGIKNQLDNNSIGVRYGRWHMVLSAEKIVTVDDGNGGTEKKTVTKYSATGRDDTSGETDKTIIVIENDEASVKVKFHLVLTEIDTQVQGSGNLGIAVEYTSSAVKRIEGALFKAPGEDGTLVPVEGEAYSFKSFTGSKYELSDVPAGKYVAAFNFYDALTGGNKLNANPYEEYVYIVKDNTSESSVYVQSLDDVYTISYIPAPSVSAPGSFTRHSEKITLPAAKKSDGTNELDSDSKLFCGWYDNSSFSGTPVTEIPAGSRGHKILYGKYVNAAEAESLPNLTLDYLDSGIAESDTTNQNKPQVGNTIILGTAIKSTCTYQWYSIDGETESDISGATTNSYKLTSDKIGKKIGLRVSKTYSVADVTEGSQVIYHTVAAGNENASAVLKSSGEEAVITQGTLDLAGINIQYGGKVIAGNKPNKSSLVLSGILKDIYGNTISNSLLKGDFEDYSALSASKKLNVTISVDGYTIASGTDTSVYITVQKSAPTGVGLKDSTGLETGKVAFNDATVAMAGLQYSTNSGTSWNLVTADSFDASSGSSIRLRYGESGTVGQEGYTMASEYIEITVLAKNVGGNTVPTTDRVVLKKGSELNDIFANKLRAARYFKYSTETPTGDAWTISDSNSTVEVKAWNSGTNTTSTINISAEGYDGDILLNEDCAGMFANLKTLISIDLSKFTTKDGTGAVVKNMASMFENCTRLVSINFGDNFDTSAVTNMSGMFAGDERLEELDLTGFNTESVTDMSRMFEALAVAELDLSKFKTPVLTNMKNMFAECVSLEILTFGDDFDTSNVTDMSGLFKDVWFISELDLNKFDTSSVTTMVSMFEGMESLEILDLSTFKTSGVTTMASMFKSCIYLSKIYVGQGWNTSSVTDSGSEMFLSCGSLTGGNGTVYTNSYKDVSYAVIDTPETPGYLTKLGE